MCIRLFIFLTAFGWGLPARSQLLRRPMGSAYTGVGAYSRNHADLFSFTSNPAALGSLKNMAIGVYGERRYLLKELSQYSLAAAMPGSLGNFGLEFYQAGFAGFREMQFGLSYAHDLGKKADAGIRFGYHTTSIGAGYGSAAALTAGGGVVLHISERLHTGLSIYNPVGGKFGKGKKEKLASVYQFGCGYEASDQFYIGAVIEKEEAQPVNVHAGIQYQPIPILLLRAGINTASSSALMGAGFRLKQFRIDITAAVHPQLGISPGILLICVFERSVPQNKTE